MVRNSQGLGLRVQGVGSEFTGLLSLNHKLLTRNPKPFVSTLRRFVLARIVEVVLGQCGQRLVGFGLFSEFEVKL